MKYLGHICAVILGGLFVFASSFFLFELGTPPAPEAGSLVADFMELFASTGYLTFVKILELIGGIFLLIPASRRIGLLIVGPIVVNIAAYHIFIAKEGLFEPMMLVLIVTSLVLVWLDREKFINFIK